MSSKEIINLIKRYCIKNGIRLKISQDLSTNDIEYLTHEYKGEPIIIIIDTYLNKFNTVTTKTEFYQIYDNIKKR
jgi:hypothetical protein